MFQLMCQAYLCSTVPCRESQRQRRSLIPPELERPQDKKNGGSTTTHRISAKRHQTRCRNRNNRKGKEQLADTIRGRREDQQNSALYMVYTKSLDVNQESFYQVKDTRFVNQRGRFFILRATDPFLFTSSRRKLTFQV